MARQMQSAASEGRVSDYLALKEEFSAMEQEQTEVTSRPQEPKLPPSQALAWGQEMRERYGVELFLSGGREDDSWVVLRKIIIPKEQRGSGVGSKIMKEIIEEADRSGWKLSLTPDDAFGGSVKRLNEFYRRFGFVPNRGRTKDFTTQDLLIRKPSS